MSVRGEKGDPVVRDPGAGLDRARIGEKATLLRGVPRRRSHHDEAKTESGYVSGDGSGQLSQYGVLTTKSATSIARREDTTLATQPG